MAKAREIEVDPFEPFSRAAARVVRVRAEELFEPAEGVLDTSDIERVHDMRVASRRLRAVLEIFAPCFPKAELKPVLSDVKDLADALGERRDPDVQIAALEALEEEVQTMHRPGVEALLERVRARQVRGNDALAAALEHMRESELERRLRALTEAAA